LYSQPNHLTYIDCRDFQVEPIAGAIDPQSYELLIVFCGRSRILSGTGYNMRVSECEEAARLLLGYAGQAANGDVKLGQVDAAIFDAEGGRLPEVLHKRATHFFGEYQRVTEGLAAWKAGDLSRFGGLVNQSGESSIKFYESGSPQLKTLYEILSQTPGVYGTRFSGAGFGGSCIALIDPAARDAIAEVVHGKYPLAHPEEADLYSIHICRSAGSAQILE
jgi:galactokinase/galacturonokinase